MAAMNEPIKTYSLEGLQKVMKELGQPSFRGRQLAEWLYTHHVSSYDEMTNLPAKLRAELTDKHPLEVPRIVDKQVSCDGTMKYVIEYEDGARVEMVAIPSNDSHERMTVCFSTQAGCPMECAFCATGKEGLIRNLTPGEIVDQVLIAQEDTGTRVTNIVGMGQGEPFLNYDNTLSALRILNNAQGNPIGARHIVVSTCGIVPGIDRFANEPEQFTLAVSLHAARQEVRDRLMPKTASYPLAKLRRSISSYLETTNRRVTFEYIMIDSVNDTEKDLEALVSFCDGLLCHINLIPINTIAGSPYRPSSTKTMNYWIGKLHRKGIETTIRNSRGNDIAGACGQLKNKVSNS